MVYSINYIFLFSNVNKDVKVNGADAIKWTAHGIKSTSRGPVPKSLAFEFSSGPTPRTKREKTPINVF